MKKSCVHRLKKSFALILIIKSSLKRRVVQGVAGKRGLAEDQEGCAASRLPSKPPDPEDLDTERPEWFHFSFVQATHNSGWALLRVVTALITDAGI